MRIVFLGTNGWFDTETGNTLCTLINTRKEYIILDAGNGLYKVDKYIKHHKPIYLFLSHFHLDHIIGLHILDKFKFSQGIDIVGPPGLKIRLNAIMKKPYTISLRRLKSKVRLHELNRKPKISLNFESAKLHHSTLCYGYRFALENKIVSYCTDTGVCENLLTLAKNADLLITECAFKSGQINKNWPHLNPKLAASVAKDAKVNKLALVHFDASLYLNIKDRMDAQAKAREIFKKTFAICDNETIKL